MGHAKRPALALYVLGAFCELDVGVGGESLSIAGKAGAAGSSHGVMVAASTGGIEASTSLTPRCFGSFISMSRVIHLKTLALKVKDSGITTLIPAKIRMITITTPMMINMAVPT
jgi:hypothetical protein